VLDRRARSGGPLPKIKTQPSVKKLSPVAPLTATAARNSGPHQTTKLIVGGGGGQTKPTLPPHKLGVRGRSRSGWGPCEAHKEKGTRKGGGPIPMCGEGGFPQYCNAISRTPTQSPEGEEKKKDLHGRSRKKNNAARAPTVPLHHTLHGKKSHRTAEEKLGS